MRDADIADIRREIRKLLDPVTTAINDNANNIANLTTRVSTVEDQGSFASITNILDNSHPEYSKDAYAHSGVLPATVGDDNLECHNWFRQVASATELIPLSANALKTAKTIEPADHSLWAANEGIDANIPRWDKTNGVIEFGSAGTAWDLIVPMSNDLIFPGQIFYVQFEAMIRTSSSLPNIQAYCGLYDNTSGQRKYIEGGNFTITDGEGNDPGVTFGIPGSTSVDYKVIAYTDSGEKAESNVLNFPNAPATFDGNNHPVIKFSGVPGFIKFEIYRKIGSTTVLQYTVGNSIEGDYHDIGNPPQAVVADFPSLSGTKPKAYTVTRTFAPGSISGLGWVRHELTIYVPTTYNKSVTGPGMQYFRFGFNGATTDARQVSLRRFGLSMGSGKWDRSANDTRTNAHSSPSTTATGSGPSDDGGVQPPDCVLMDTMIDMLTPIAYQTKKPLHEVEKGDLTDSGGSVCGKVLYVKWAYASRVFHVRTEGGLTVSCTHNHPLITSVLDFNGTPCETLKKRLDAGEDVFTLTRPKDKIVLDRIISIDIEYGDFEVGIPTLDGSHICILNGFLSHNRKNT